MPIVAVPSFTIGVTGVQFLIEVDWDDDGVFEGGVEDISADVLYLTWDQGRDGELETTPGGTLTLEVHDPSGDYSPEKAAPVFGAGNVVPGRRVRVRATFAGTTYQLFQGRIEKITPSVEPGFQNAELFCVDGFDQLGRTRVLAPADTTHPLDAAPLRKVKLGHRGVTKVSGVSLTFTVTAETIDRASGSFVTDGYQTGMMIRVRGATQFRNNSLFEIVTVTATQLTLTASANMVNETTGAATIETAAAVTELLDAANWPSANRVLDEGVDLLDWWWVAREFALDHVHKLEDVERSWMYVSKSGDFTYEDRHHRLKGDHLTSQFHFNGTGTVINYEVSTRPVRNQAQVSGHKRVAKASAILYGTQDRPKIPANSSITLIIDLSAPASSIVFPLNGTHLTANSSEDGSGTNLNLAISHVVTFYGQQVKWVITNNGNTPAFLLPGTKDPDQTLVIEGTELSDEKLVAPADDVPSQDKFQLRGIDVDNPFIANFNALKGYAEWLVSRFKDPQPDFVQLVVEGTDSTLITQLLSRNISDRVTLTVSQLGISAKDYFINRMVHEVEAGGFHRATYSLARATEEQYWLLGTTGFSELGQTTSLGF